MSEMSVYKFRSSKRIILLQRYPAFFTEVLVFTSRQKLVLCMYRDVRVRCQSLGIVVKRTVIMILP